MKYSFYYQQGSTPDLRVSDQNKWYISKESWQGQQRLNVSIVQVCDTKEEAIVVMRAAEMENRAKNVSGRTVLTNTNMGVVTPFFYAVCAYIEKHSKYGDPDYSLQDWLSHGDYEPVCTVNSVIAEWDGNRK